MHKIAVIIPCYNNEAHLRKAISSALAQAGVALEVVVVDDGSTDTSVAIARSFGDSVVVIEQANQGACAARNHGLAETRAPFVKFLDADDYLAPGCLFAQADRLAVLPEDHIVFGDGLWVDEAERPLGHFPEVALIGGSSLSPADVIEHTPLTSCPLHRRNLLEAVGGFDSRCQRAQEYDLHVRLALTGARFVYQSGLIYYYVQHASAGRISQRDRDIVVLQNKYEAHLRHVEIAERVYVGELPHEVGRCLGQALWKTGRMAARLNEKKLANSCFQEAKRVAGQQAVVGSISYKLLSKVVAPSFLG